ncbi:hypothetical protein ACVWZR_004496 [Bradyrhizobium sp. i1.3.1]
MPAQRGGDRAVPLRHRPLLNVVERLAAVDVRAKRRTMDPIAVAHLPGEAADLDHAGDVGIVHPGAVRHRGGGEVRSVDDLGDGIVPGIGSLHLALGARKPGLVVEQLELRRGFVPALLQRAGELVAACEIDGRECRADPFIAALLGLLGFGEFCLGIVLAKDGALGIATIVAQREHAMEDRLVGSGEPRRLETVAVATERSEHLDRGRGQRTGGQQSHQGQEKRAYRFLKHCHESGGLHCTAGHPASRHAKDRLRF